MRLLALGAILYMLTLCQPLLAALSQEAYWAQTLKQTTNQDEIVWLNRRSEKVLALLKDDKTGNPQGAAIILHSAGTHPDWRDVIRPLRKTLPEYGWVTMAVQMPVLDHNQNLQDYAPLMKDVPGRIDSAVNELIARGIQNIVLIGHDLGAIMAADYIANHSSTPISAFIGISMSDYAYLKPGFDINQSLEKIAVPILDIYGSRDYTDVIETARARAEAARMAGQTVTRNKQLNGFQQSATARSASTKVSGFIAYRRLVIAGAGHDFRDFEPLLVKRIVGWLKRHAGGISLAQGFK